MAPLVLCLAGVGATLVDRQPPPRTRTVPDAGKMLADYLKPEDEVVLIERDDHGVVMMRQPTLEEAIAYKVRFADIVATVDVAAVDGISVDAGTWINTRVVGRINETLLNRNPRPLPGPIEFQFDGGEMRIGSVLVKAGRREKIVPGKQYLVFLQIMDDGVAFPSYGPFVVEGGKVRKTVEISARSGYS